MAKLFLITLLTLLSGITIAEVDITRPNLTLTDMNGVPIEGVTASTSEVKAMAKASKLPNGTYLLKRPDAVITVSGVDDPVEPPPPPPPPVDPIYHEAIVSWTAPTTYSNGEPFTDTIVGYSIHYGTSTSLGTVIDAGNVTTYPVAGLVAGTYYFAVRLYTADEESSLTNTVTFEMVD